MNDLRIIAKDLVPVYETSTGEKVVYGSELHAALEVKSPYREWSNRRFKDCDAKENEDFHSVEYSTLVGGSPKKDHIIKLDTAKEMAMLERNDKGKEVRRYFIQVEKKFKEQQKINFVDPETEKIQTMRMNAITRMANMYLKLSKVDTLSENYKNILVAKASEVLSGEQLIPLPKLEQKTYSATEIGEVFGITANKVGRLANKHNLKTSEYGEYRRDKSRSSAKEVDTWVYFESVIPEFKKILGKAAM